MGEACRSIVPVVRMGPHSPRQADAARGSRASSSTWMRLRWRWRSGCRAKGFIHPMGHQCAILTYALACMQPGGQKPRVGVGRPAGPRLTKCVELAMRSPPTGQPGAQAKADAEFGREAIRNAREPDNARKDGRYARKDEIAIPHQWATKTDGCCTRRSMLSHDTRRISSTGSGPAGATSSGTVLFRSSDKRMLLHAPAGMPRPRHGGGATLRLMPTLIIISAVTPRPS